MTVYRRGIVWYFDFQLDGRRYGPKRIGPVTRRLPDPAVAQMICGTLSSKPCYVTTAADDTLRVHVVR